MIGESIQHRLMLIAIVVAVLVCLLLWLTGRAIARAIALISFVLGICVLSFVCGPSLGGPDNWSAVLAVATLLAVVAALFLDDIRALLHRPKIELRVEPGLVSCVLILLTVRMNRRRNSRKRSQLFVRTHNEAIAIISMRVSNPDCRHFTPKKTMLGLDFAPASRARNGSESGARSLETVTQTEQNRECSVS